MAAKKVGKAHGHIHTFDDTKRSGRTSTVNGHDHTYQIGLKSTGPGGEDNHTHPMPSTGLRRVRNAD